jgi:hypothetical protein
VYVVSRTTGWPHVTMSRADSADSAENSDGGDGDSTVEQEKPRDAAAHDASQHPNPIRRRGPRACRMCIERKLRCSLAAEGSADPPCTGCISRGIPCEPGLPKKRKKTFMHEIAPNTYVVFTDPLAGGGNSSEGAAGADASGRRGGASSLSTASLPSAFLRSLQDGSSSGFTTTPPAEAPGSHRLQTHSTYLPPLPDMSREYANRRFAAIAAAGAAAAYQAMVEYDERNTDRHPTGIDPQAMPSYPHAQAVCHAGLGSNGAAPPGRGAVSSSTGAASAGPAATSHATENAHHPQQSYLPQSYQGDMFPAPLSQMAYPHIPHPHGEVQMAPYAYAQVGSSPLHGLYAHAPPSHEQLPSQTVHPGWYLMPQGVPHQTPAALIQPAQMQGAGAPAGVQADGALAAPQEQYYSSSSR